MSLQTGKDPMISHPLSTVYGMYVIEVDGEARFCTADRQFLFEQLERVSFKDCGKLKVILLSSEEFARDDITAFVWEAMVEDYARGFAHETLDQWDEHVGIDTPFCRWGFDEFDVGAERSRRRAERPQIDPRPVAAINYRIAAE